MATANVLAAILAIITAIYVLLTHRILRTNVESLALLRAQNEAASRPYVVVAPTISASHVFYLRIQNLGRAAATNLQLTLDRDFFRFGHKNLPDHNVRSYPAFQQSLPSFPPGADLLFALAQSFVVLPDNADDSATPKVFTVTATYGYGGKTITEEWPIDLRAYHSGTSAPDPLVDKLEEIRKVLEQT